MRQLSVIFLFLMAFPMFAQEKELPDFNAVDSLYREDQFYFGFTYDILQKRPEGLKQNKFSSGFTIGFLRDMPINKSRTFAIAAGLGYSINNFNQNLLITGNGDGYDYSTIDPELAYDKNKIILHYIDLPIEFRWRTSTPESHKFWRIYTGLKFSYLVFNRYKFKDGDTEFSSSSNDDFTKFQYGVYLATGYNTWNLNIYYGLNPIFNSGAQLNGKPIDMHTLNVGLMFYIL